MKGVGASSRIFELLMPVDGIESQKRSVQRIENMKGLIEFKNVSFAYPSRPDVPVFTNLSFRVEPGTNVAIVGHSGSGKSSIAQLLLRFYDPSNIDGVISIDGIDLKDLDLRWWRHDVIGFVAQEPALFAGSVFDNIKYGREDGAAEKDIFLAAEQANARAFIESFPDGFQTVVGDRGVGVSGGQKQVSLSSSYSLSVLQSPEPC
jgi:ABC-type multidrug transport system fused ATPase/permease subunit